MINLEKIMTITKNKKLLYVEDNKAVREMTKILLSSFFDNIIEAIDGEDGLDKYKQVSPDLVITDINMPKMNGNEMSHKIRDLDNTIPIIVLSAHNENDVRDESTKNKITEYLLKPIELEELVEVLGKTFLDGE